MPNAIGWRCGLLLSSRASGTAPWSNRTGIGALPCGWACAISRALGRADFDRIEAARKAAPFASVEDVAARAGLDQGALSTLAEAGAMESLTPSRRAALWQALGEAQAKGGRSR